MQNSDPNLGERFGPEVGNAISGMRLLDFIAGGIFLLRDPDSVMQGWMFLPDRGEWASRSSVIMA